jgi:hypothetical protein
LRKQKTQIPPHHCKAAVCISNKFKLLMVRTRLQQLLSLTIVICVSTIFSSQKLPAQVAAPKIENEPQASTKTSVASVVGTGRDRVQLVLEFAVPFVKETRRTQDQAGLAELEIASPTTDHLLMNQVYRIPSYHYIMQAHVQSARVVAEEGVGVLQNVSLKFHPEVLEDVPIGAPEAQWRELKTGTKADEQENFPKEKLKWFYAGSMRGTPLTSLTVSPYIYSPKTKTLRYVQKMVIECQLNSQESSPETFKVDIDEAQLMQQAPRHRRPYKPLGKMWGGRALSFSEAMGVQQNVWGGLPVVPKYRFIVNKDGVYRLGFFEFQDAEFPADFFTADPRTFRLFNKGREVPIYVKGEQDGRFNRDDYIEFIGEPHRLAFSDPNRPDMYNDPYTDENVYYFYWEQTATPQNRGLRLVEIPAEPRATSGVINLRNQSFRSTVHFEEDGVTERFALLHYQFNSPGYRRTRNHSDAGDKRFWYQILTDRGASATISIPAPQTNNSTDSIIIRAAFHGISTSVPRFRANVFFSLPVDFFQVMRAEWGDGRPEQLATIARAGLSPLFHRLLGGVSAVRIGSGELNATVSFPLFYFNWIEVTYRRLYRAVEDEIVFTTPPDTRPGRYQFTISGFTTPDIEIYKKGVGRLGNFTVEQYEVVDERGEKTGRQEFRAIFQDEVLTPRDVEYIALTNAKKLLPLRIEKVTAANFFDTRIKLRDKSNAYNFIIITSRAFFSERDAENPLSPIRQYKENREARLRALGEPNRVLVTTVDNIYDEFNDGIKSPYAIREFLAYAYHEWREAPTYVLLIGDAVFGKIAPTDVPTMHVQTYIFGATASDAWFAMIDGIDVSGQLDLVPDLQIARIPAQSRDDVLTYLQKLIVYEQPQTLSEWRNRILLIAGEAESGRGSIAEGTLVDKVVQTDQLIDSYIDRSVFVDRLHTSAGRNRLDFTAPPDKYRGGQDQLINTLNQTGAVVVNFMGHGGGGIWGDSQVLTREAVDRLRNSARLPFITSMTCFVGAFDDLSSVRETFVNSPITLTEKLLLSPERGCIGMIASAGLGWFINDFLMAQAIYEFLLNERFQDLSIGDMLFRGKIRYYLQYRDFYVLQAPTMMYQYGVFGDPALRLALPRRTTPTGAPAINWNLPTHMVGVGNRLVIRGTVNGITNGNGFGRITDQNNLEVTPTTILFQVRNGRIGQLVGGQFVDSLVITVPQPPPITSTNILNFSRGGGQFKAHIISDDGRTDVSGFVRFSNLAPFVQSVTPSSDIRTSENRAVTFTVRVEARQPLQSVSVRATVTRANSTTLVNETLFDANLPATQSGANTFVTTSGIPATFMQRGNRVTYSAIARAGNEEGRSGSIEVIVGQQADVAAVEQVRAGLNQFYDNPTIDFYPDGNRAVIGAEVYNWSNEPGAAQVIFYENSVNNSLIQNIPPRLRATRRVIGTTTVRIPARGKILATVPVPASFQLLQTYNVAVQVVADSSLAPDADARNNLSNQRPITYNLVFVQNNAAASIQIDSNCTLSYEPATFSRNGFIRVERLENPQKVAQPDNEFVRLASQSDTATTRFAYRITAADSALGLSRQIRLTMRLNPRDFATRRAFVNSYFFSEELERWLRIPTQSKPDINTVVMNYDRFGTFSIMHTNDQTQPQITLGIEGQEYVPGGFAPRRPRIVAVLQDQNGIYLDRRFIRVIRNGDSSAAVQEKLNIPITTPNANSVGITYDDEFPNGRQEVAFLFYDANLNLRRSDTLRFVVEDNFRLRVYGAYPNPFEDRTFIGYEIIGQEPADEFEIKIYTASGRLINTFRQPGVPTPGFENNANLTFTQVGGRVVEWTGLDERGNPVANGVYYAKVRLVLRGRVLEEIIKIARLR